jgi:hypothetical protein
MNPMTTADASASINRQASLGGWSRPCLVDLRGVTWLPTPAEIRRLTKQIEHLNAMHGRRGPVAFVVDGHRALFGMLRMYSILADDIDDIDVFDNVDAAMPWLVTHTSRMHAASKPPSRPSCPQRHCLPICTPATSSAR